jgi:benzoate/toluate 1,2-dioxygenase alpha subunit
VKNPEGAGYPECFNKNGSHDLTKIARFESYRGFLFGSLNPNVVPLVEHLGEAAKIIDLIVDQSPEGLEILRGASTYVYDGNWKLQSENGADGYHVTSVHWNYAATTSRRKQAEKPDDIRAMDAGSWAKQGGGFYSFENGSGPTGPTRKTGRIGTAVRNWPRNSVRRVPTGWCSARAISASTRTFF